MSIKIVYFMGNDSKAKGILGKIEINDNSFKIHGDQAIQVPFQDIRTVEIQILNGIGSFVKVIFGDETLNMVVPRLNFGGNFVIGNQTATNKLCRDIQCKLSNSN